MKRARRGVPALLAGIWIATAVAATAAAGVDGGQAPAVAAAEATLTGTVNGPDGARVPGASMTLSHVESGLTVRSATSAQGTLRVAGLRPGAYTVRAEAPGFQAWTESLVLGSGETREVRVELRLAGVRETLTVLGAASRDSLEATAIRETAARDVGEALASTPGAFRLRKGGIASDVVLRGLKGADVNVLLDGQRLHGACPNRMDPPAFHVDFAEVERVEISKGPFDVRSQGGLGGAVNVVTRRPPPGWHVSGSLGLGAFGYVNPSVSASYGTERLAALAGFSYRRSEPYADGDGRRFTEIANYGPADRSRDSFRLATGWARLALQSRDGQRVQLAWTHQQADDVLYPYLLMDGIDDGADRVNFVYEAGGTATADRLIAVQAYYARVEHWMSDQFRSSSAVAPRGYSMATQAETRTLGGRVELRTQRAFLGTELYQHRWDASTELAGMAYRPQASLPDVGIESIGVYGELRRSLGERLELSLGGRVDHVRSAADEAKANGDLYFAYHQTRSTSRRDTRPSGRLRLEWRPASGLALAASLGHAARMPDANELYFALRRMGSDWVGNPELAPSRNTGIEAEIRYERAGRAITASLYWNRIDDFITVASAVRAQAVPGVTNTGARSWANVDATLRGGELAGSLPLPGRLFLSGELSAVLGRQRAGGSDQSSDLAEIPPPRARLGLRYDDGRLFALVEGVFSARQERVDESLGEQPTPGWGIANLSTGWRGARLAVTLGIANLLDRAYSEHLSFQRDPFRSGVRLTEPGRSLFLNASLQLP